MLGRVFGPVYGPCTSPEVNEKKLLLILEGPILNNLKVSYADICPHNFQGNSYDGVVWLRSEDHYFSLSQIQDELVPESKNRPCIFMNDGEFLLQDSCCIPQERIKWIEIIPSDSLLPGLSAQQSFNILRIRPYEKDAKVNQALIDKVAGKLYQKPSKKRDKKAELTSLSELCLSLDPNALVANHIYMLDSRFTDKTTLFDKNRIRSMQILYPENFTYLKDSTLNFVIYKIVSSN